MALTSSVTLSAVRRVESGKGAARKLRAQGRVPAVVYGQGREPEHLAVELADFEKAMAGHSSSSIVDLTVDGTTLKAVVRDVQRHPVRPGILHIDFYEIHEGVSLTVDVPIHLHGIPEGVKTHGGVLDQVLRELTIEVLPKHIPEHIDIDVSGLGVGQSIHVGDLDLPDFKVLDEPTATICSVAHARVEEVAGEEEAEEEEALEPELIRKPKDEDEAAAGTGEE